MPYQPPHILKAIESLQRLADLFGERREQLARGVGLTVQQWRVLEEISGEHFMPSMFARSRESSAAAVSKIIRQLLDKNLIEVSVSDGDGRQRRYRLTRQGSAVMKNLRRHRQSAIEAIWGSLPAAQLNGFTAFSTTLAERMETYEKQL